VRNQVNPASISCFNAKPSIDLLCMCKNLLAQAINHYNRKNAKSTVMPLRSGCSKT
jgi:hypothetical protein